MEKLLENEKAFYRKTSIYTNYGPYKNYFLSLPDDLKELTTLVNAQYIHRITLRKSYIEHNEISKKYPWYQYRLHDDILLTAPAMTAELLRLDRRGCRRKRNKTQNHYYLSICIFLLASILKAKGYIARVRSGFATYFHVAPYLDKNFDALRYLFREDKKLRAINTPLMSDQGHLE